MNTKPDIICFSSTDWDDVWGSRQQIMLRFAQRGHRVFFFERPVGPEHLMRYPTMRENKLHRWREGPRQIDERLWIISLPLLLPGRYFSHLINSINQYVVLSWTKRFLKQMAIDDPILWLYKPEFGKLIGQYNEIISVYHCIDEFTVGTKGHKKRVIQSLEEQLLQRVDLVFANSTKTYQNKLQKKPNTYQIPSAADISHFAQSMNPDLVPHSKIEHLSHPIAGFIGNITKRIDIDLLTETAITLKHWQFVLIGQVYTQRKNIRHLQKLPNVTFLGQVPFIDLPSLAKCVDVFLLPYIDGEHSLFRSPLKLYEYLATGRPIVSTPHPEVYEFKELILIGASKNEFTQQILNSQQDTEALKAQRLSFAKQNSWDHRVDQMEAIITSQIAK